MATYKSKKAESKAEEALEQYAEPLNFKNVWLMFQETALQIKETDRKIQETDRLMKEQSKETDRIMKETEKKFQETDRLVKEQLKETDRKIQETTDNINQMRGHFDKQFGKLVEALIQHSTINLFKEAGIQITHSSPNPERIYADKNMEFDLLLLNDTELVVLEAKVSLTKQKVYQFIKKIENFKLFFKEYASYSVLAGLAYITSKSDACELAEANGFYLLKLRNEEYMAFANTQQFSPTTY